MGYSPTPQQILAGAIVRVGDAQKGLMPYMGHALNSLIRREAPGLGTVGVTAHGILLWDPEFVGKLPVDEVAGLMIHEVMHRLLRHHERAADLGILAAPGVDPDSETGRKAWIWNRAADSVINDSLRQAGVKLPPDGIYPEVLEPPQPRAGQPGGPLTAEESFRRLWAEEQKKQQKNGKKSGAQGQQGAGQGQPQQAPAAGAGGAGARGKQNPGAASGRCGSCCGNPSHGEPSAEEDARDGRSTAELDRVQRVVAEEIRKHVAAKGRGTVPSALECWADEVLSPPKVDWRVALAHVLRAAVAYRKGAVDLGWHRPSRRQAGLGYGAGVPQLPAFRAPVPEVAIIVDTSGSMGNDEMIEAISETDGILKTVGAKATFCAIDSQVHGIQRVNTAAEAGALLKGGGGTNMIPAFEAVLATQPKPQIIVCITDGQLGNGRPATEPDGIRVVWLLIGQHRTTEWVKEYGDIIEIDGDEARAA